MQIACNYDEKWQLMPTNQYLKLDSWGLSKYFIFLEVVPLQMCVVKICQLYLAFSLPMTKQTYVIIVILQK